MLRLFINLDRAPKRLELIEQRLSHFSCPFERVAAIDGKSLNQSDIDLLKPHLFSLNKIWFPYQLINNEYACFLSHRKCWEKLVESKEDYAVILEDDVEFSPDAEAYLTNSDWIPSHVHIIQLAAPFAPPQTLYVKNQSIVIHKNNYANLYEIVAPTAIGAIAYIISRKAATIALEMSSQIAAPVDEFLFSPKSPLRKKFSFFKLSPGIGYQCGITSTISTHPRNGTKPLIARLHPYSFFLKFKLICKRLTHTQKVNFFSQRG